MYFDTVEKDASLKKNKIKDQSHGPDISNVINTPNRKCKMDNPKYSNYSRIELIHMHATHKHTMQECRFSLLSILILLNIMQPELKSNLNILILLFMSSIF